MNSIVCEMCGSNNLLKDNGFYCCQNCGTKYTIEEAKKLIVEGTVKIDHSDLIERSLQNARRAKEKEDWDETEKYYNIVEQYAPDNIEAIFYSSYGKAKKSLVESDLYRRQDTFKVLTNCVSLIDDNYDIADDDNKQMIQQISNDIFALTTSDYVYNQWKNGYGVVTRTDKMSTITLFNGVNIGFATSLENIAEKIPTLQKSDRVFFYNMALQHLEFVLRNGSLANPNIVKAHIIDLHRLWYATDSSHSVPYEAPPAGKKQKSGEGCYIATAVYGSYNCPQVWTLRRYRDFMLSTHRSGRCFIRLYYTVSPIIVRRFGNKKLFRTFWRRILDRKVKRLKNQGIDNSPYEDINWRKK